MAYVNWGDDTAPVYDNVEIERYRPESDTL